MSLCSLVSVQYKIYITVLALNTEMKPDVRVIFTKCHRIKQVYGCMSQHSLHVM
jgi:hypothetical protein